MNGEPKNPGDRIAHEMFIAGGGEMGLLVRSIDWQKTALGDLAEWPQSLRTTMSICLNSRFPIAVYWGPEYHMLYNESLIPMVGPSKHPAALGRPARVVLAEIWQIIEPLLRMVKTTGEATWQENLMLPLARTGRPEESYFTFTYSPIRDEAGGVGGVFCAVVETTDTVIEGRRLRLLNALAEAVHAQTPAAACAHAAAEIAKAPNDVPFALLYLFDDAGAAVLAGAANIAAGSALAPALIRPGERAPWPFEDLKDDVHYLPLTDGPAGARGAVILPIEQSRAGRRMGFVVAGLAPMLSQSDSYSRFHKLLAGSISQGVSGAAAYEQERKRAEALAEIDRVKTAFFSNVSHEFRTPLTLMLGPAEDALRDTSLPAGEVQRWLLVQRNALRLSKLVNTLLDFSRLEAGRVEASYEPTDLSGLTNELASMFDSAVTRGSLRLKLDLPPLAEHAYVDREMWEKIVLNLLSNALKFTFEGEIAVSLQLEEDGFALTVRDTGVGIPAAELPHVFDRFHRFKGTRSRTHEGTGIGLALVAELIKLHGGRVQVESEEMRGTTFTVRLPRGHRHLPEGKLREARALKTSPGAAPYVEEALRWTARDEGAAGEESHPESHPAARILVADDNADMRQYLRKLLSDRGWPVEVVADGASALAFARSHRPDLILTDIMMPGLDGFALMLELRKAEATRDIPVILLSARAGEEARVEGMQAGAADYIVKPFSGKELVSRVAARLEVAHAHAQARSARARLHAQLMQAPVAVSVVSGPEFRVELANARYLEVVGRSAQQLAGKPFRDGFPELSPDAPVFQMMDEVYRSGTPYTADEYHVTIARNGVLEDVYFLFTCQPIRGEAGVVTEIMTVAVDVTAQVVARRRIEGLMQDLREGDQRKDEFLATLAHELRNPMAAISMALGLMEKTGGDAVNGARHREIAQRQVRNLVRLVDDLLDVSRITRGAVELRKEEVDLRVVVTNAVAAARASLDARNHQVTVTVSPGNYLIQADATRLEQVVSNLLTNAAKYTDPGGLVSVTLSVVNAQAVLRVRDTGRGIPAEMLGKVFDMFVQVQQTIDRGMGGLGLGLTLVKRLVEMHGGTVSAHSDGPGKGSEFMVRLPMQPAEPTVSPNPRNTAAEALAEERRIVLVEDSEDIRETLQEFLEDLGHEVAVAANGPDGAALVLANLPDIAFIDVGLPGIDGYEVARRVRAGAGGKQLYLVALTGYGGLEAKKIALDAGFNLHLTKPVDILELPRIVSRAKKLR